MAVIGLGQRGYSLMKNILLAQPDVEVIGVCDTYQDRVDQAVEKVKEIKGNTPLGTLDYKEIFTLSNLDAVLVATAWEFHNEITIYSLRKGIPVAMEVGGAYCEQELWELVRAYEETKTPLMFMENCCYDRCEVLATKMARAGLFGKIVHMEGSYSHDLRYEIAGGNILRHYRLRNYINRNCDNYPTHEIGPIAKLLDINRGNRFVSLVSVASKAEGLKEYVNNNLDKYGELSGVEFKQGDIVTTIIKCANGETVTIKLDTTLPRFYSRHFTIRGTKGFYEQNTNTVFLDKVHKEDMWTPAESYKCFIDNAKEYEEEYLPDFWKNITKEQLEAGHGGMDFFEFRAFIDALKNGEEMPIDVYDAATWMAITDLSERSILNNGAPVDFPDFTCGKWILRPRKDVF
jgi:predicted dehydrogenase